MTQVKPCKQLFALRIAPVLGSLLMLTRSAMAEDPRSAFTLVKRVVTQDQGAWVIDYHLRKSPGPGTILTRRDIELTVQGWVSNSRVAAHASPRWSNLSIPRDGGFHAETEVIASLDEATRCRESLTVSVWSREHPASMLTSHHRRSFKTGTYPSDETVGHEAFLSVGPLHILQLRMRLEHQHILLGDYDPLLGERAIELRLGNSVIRDLVPLDHEQYLAFPHSAWPEPPDDRRDTKHARSGPDSLHIEAHIPGHQFYRFPERAVRHGSRMVLRFWYLIAHGTEGECRVRLAQVKDTPIAYRVLTQGVIDEALTQPGQWTKFERSFRIEEDATKVTLEFKIVGEAEIGEMWIDDISLEPLGASQDGP